MMNACQSVHIKPSVQEHEIWPTNSQSNLEELSSWIKVQVSKAATATLSGNFAIKQQTLATIGAANAAELGAMGTSRLQLCAFMVAGVDFAISFFMSSE